VPRRYFQIDNPLEEFLSLSMSWQHRAYAPAPGEHFPIEG
jgi:hypothetical protein